MALAVVLAASSLSWPFGWDQGIFASVGHAIVQGGLPYRDAWDIKGPLGHYVYALAEFTFGQNRWSIRVIDALIATLMTVGLVRLARRFLPGRAARWAGVAGLFWYASGNYWNTAQPDAWVGAMLVGLMLLVTNRPMRAGRAVAAGLLVGCCALVKYHYAGFLVVPAAAAWIDGRARVRHLALLGSTVLVAPALAAGWFALHGALGEAVYAYLEWPLTGYSGLDGLSLSTSLRLLGQYLSPSGIPLLVAPALVAGVVALWRRRERDDLLLLLWALSGVLAVAVQRRFFVYHWTVVTPALALLVVLGIRDARRALPGRRMRVALLGYAGLVAMRMVASPAFEVLETTAWVSGVASHEAYYRHFRTGGIDFLEAERLRDSTAVDEPVAIWGPNADVAYLAGRPPLDRFTWNTPLLIGRHARRYQEFIDAYFADLRRVRPQYFIESTETGSVVSRYPGLVAIPGLADWIHTHYRLVRIDSHLRIYRRIDGPASPKDRGQRTRANALPAPNQ